MNNGTILKPKSRPPLENPIFVYSTSNLTDILFAKMLLGLEGVPFATANEQVNSAFPSMFPVSFFVEYEYGEYAQTLLQHYLSVRS